MPHICPECFNDCECASGETEVMDCNHVCEDEDENLDESWMSDIERDEAQYNYED